MGQEIALSTYAGFFLALMIGGETVLLPALYLGINGTLDLPLIIFLSITATIFADMVLYVLGSTIPHKELSLHAILARYKVRIDPLTRVFGLHSLPILFASKFVYGTRAAVQILCGMHHVHFIKYFLVNVLGITILNIVYVLAATGVYRGISRVDTGTSALVLSFVLFVFVAVILQLLFKKYIWQKWFQQ